VLVTLLGDAPFVFGVETHRRVGSDPVSDPAPPVEPAVVHVDAAQRGVEEAEGGPAFRIGSGAHRWAWRLRPFTVGRDDPAALARQDVAAPDV